MANKQRKSRKFLLRKTLFAVVCVHRNIVFSPQNNEKHALLSVFLAVFD
jgi:hypothetical protein